MKNQLRTENRRRDRLTRKLLVIASVCNWAMALWLVAATPASAGDWPQILGPDRNGHAVQESLPGKWPAAGPPQLWQHEVGRGFAGVAVAGGQVMLWHRVGDQEVAEMLNATDGRRLWKTSFDAHYRGSIFPDQDGPLSVPLIDGDRVFLYGAGGDLHAVSRADGRKLWSRSLYRELRSRRGQIDCGYFGAGGSPIVEGDKLIVNVGGFSGNGIVALASTDGRTKWAVSDELPSYSSPVTATVEGIRHVVFVTRFNVVSVDPRDGAERFRFAFGRRGPTVNAAAPLVVGNRLFVTASYGVGAVMAEMDRDSARQVWANDNVLSSQYSTSVHHDGFLYGVDGRADVGVASLRCVELETGKLMWTERNFGVAAVILADGKLLIMKTDGQLLLASPSTQGFRKLDQARLFDGTVRALPALSDGRFYARDQQHLKCFQLGR